MTMKSTAEDDCSDRQKTIGASSAIRSGPAQPDTNISEGNKSDKSHRRLGSWAGPVWQSSHADRSPEGDV